MYRLKKLLVLPLAAVFILSSCSEDFKVAAPYKNITLVYGLLNMADTAHYIRIQKAFLDENKSAIDMAKQYDSNFYGALDVRLKEIDNGVEIGSEALSRVDLAAQGYPKDTGIFFNTPSFAYKSTRTLNPDHSYRLVIRNAATGETDSSETPIISGEAPVFIVREFYGNIFQVAFSGHFQGKTLDLHIQHTQQFAGMPVAGVFEGLMRFHYVNKNTATGALAPDSVDLPVTSVVNFNGGYTLSIDERTIQRSLVSTIGAPPANTVRLIGNVDIFIFAGTRDFVQYQTINGVQGGLTADQIRPIYTNIKGANTLGLFTSRASRSKLNVKIDDETVDTLMRSSVTQALAIQGRAN